jgi:hypothetical protein
MSRLQIVVLLSSLVVIVLSGVSLLNAQQASDEVVYEGQGVPHPSVTEGHHGGELAGEAYYNNKSSFLQNGSPDAERDDYLVVCGGTRANPVTGHVYNTATGFHGVRDAGRGCNGKDFPFNGEGHSIQGKSYNQHPG